MRVILICPILFLLHLMEVTEVISVSLEINLDFSTLSCNLPGFDFLWLDLVSHRMFLSYILLVNGQKGWVIVHQLLIDLFLFLEPHLCRVELTDAIKHLYKGALRLLLVLFYDFPGFLAGYNLSFCTIIPENCVKMLNLVISAFPKGMVLSDPFTPKLKIDLLPEIYRIPVILSNVYSPLVSMRADFDGYLKSRQPDDFFPASSLDSTKMV